MDLINEFIKKYALQILLGVVLVIVLFIGNMFRTRYVNNYNQVDMRVTQAVNKSVLHSTVDNEVADTYADEESGLDVSRVAEDNEVFDTFLHQYLLWTNRSEFTAQQGSLYSTYRLGDDNDFVSTFYPKFLGSGWDGSSILDKWAAIENADVSIEFGNVETHVIGINADKYSYIALVPITCSCDEFSESADFLIFYRVDARGYITGLRASQCDSLFEGITDLHGSGIIAQEEEEEEANFEAGDVLGSRDTGVIVTDVAEQ